MNNDSKFQYQLSSDDKSPSTAATFLIVAGIAGYNPFGKAIFGSLPCCFPSINFCTIVSPKTACGIIFLNSLVGLWRSGVRFYEKEADKIYQVTSYLQDNFVLPIVVSSALYQANYSPELAYANMLIPAIPFIAQAIEKEDIIEGTDDYIIGIECLILGLVSAFEEDYFGIAASISYACYHFLAKQERLSCVEIPTTAKMNIFMACFAAFIQKGVCITRTPNPYKKSWFGLDKKEPCTPNCPMNNVLTT